MKIEKFVTGIISTNCYLVINEETKQTVVIDPAACPSYLMGHIKSEGLQVEAILLTHGHFDHIMGIGDLRKEFPVPVYAHEGDRETLLDPSLNLSISYTDGYTFDGATYVRDGQTLELAGASFQVIHTPGHTPGHCSLYLPQLRVLVTGDAAVLEAGAPAVANPHFTLDLPRAEASLQKLLALDADCWLCYHGGLLRR